MLKLIEMDDSITLHQKMMTEAGPVILINKFKVKPEESDPHRAKLFEIIA